MLGERRRFDRISFLSLLLTLGLMVLQGCNYRTEKQPVGDQPNEPLSGALEFKSVFDGVLRKRCASCHSSFSSYQVVRQKASEIESRVLSRSMPPGSPLSQNQQDFLISWIRAGAPEVAEGGGKPTPEPTPAPLLATYTSIRERIFEPKCLGCHKPGGRAEDVPLHALADLLQVDGLIDREHPEISALIVAVTRNDNKRMPPVRTGAPPLSEEEVATLMEWIRQGTPE